MSGTDYDLLTGWVERQDASAFKELTDRHAPMVFSVCQRMLGNAAEAEVFSGNEGCCGRMAGD